MDTNIIIGCYFEMRLCTSHEKEINVKLITILRMLFPRRKKKNLEKVFSETDLSNYNQINLFFKSSIIGNIY